MIKRIFFLFILLVSFASAQTDFYRMNEFGLTSPGAMKFGLYGYDNPALLATVDYPDLTFTWTNYNKTWSNDRRFDFNFAQKNFGFNIDHRKTAGVSNTDYRLSSAMGDRTFSLGFGYGWSTGDPAGRAPVLWTFGAMYRPAKFLSAGIIGYFPREGPGEKVFELAVRPFASEKLALFADYGYKKTYLPDESKWSAGIAAEAFPGIRLTGRYFSNKSITAGFQLELGNIGLGTQTYFNKDQEYAYNSYQIRFGAYDRNVFRTLSAKDNYYKLDFRTGVVYSPNILLDERQKFKDVLDNIEAAKNDPAIKGIIINTSGMSANNELLWEIRQKLADFKSSGKKVIVYIDRAAISEYHLASVADQIILDPLGQMILEGYQMGRMYLKGTLEKLGIGYDEWRFFKYKSAVEVFSRDKMSDADREQRQMIINDWYKVARQEIVASRRMSEAQFDTLTNSRFIFLAQEALDLKLVDTLARWNELVDSLAAKGMAFVGDDALETNIRSRDNYWGEKPKIAVIYALGACDLESGIAARTLVKDVNAAVNDPNVKAIVLRVDSPGGDALASDYIAEQIRLAKGKKPIIVSQGFVAGSGGYWLSMYGDTIVAAPTTITGSIGVIGGWFYDNGFKKSVGVTTDLVKIGDHADLGFGILIPLINFPLPDRPFTTQERSTAESLIKRMYAEFVQKVADGRKMKFDDVAAIGQGRVWSGLEGKKIGLVDVIGGLETAIGIAQEKAHLAKGEYDLVEYPAQKLIDLSAFMPRLFSTPVKEEDRYIEALKLRLKFNGRPLYMVPLEFDIDN